MNVAGADLLALLAAGHRGSSGSSFLGVHESLLDASSARLGAVRPAAPGLRPAGCTGEVGGGQHEATANEFPLTGHLARANVN